MKVGILAGGFGTRLAEETEIRPKPMVEIGGMPILWHIMMHYHTYGHREFAVALGYKGEAIKDGTKIPGLGVVHPDGHNLIVDQLVELNANTVDDLAKLGL